jgi:hypothetical protein
MPAYLVVEHTINRVIHEIEDVAVKKVDVKGGGICIYCGWDGGEEGLHDGQFFLRAAVAGLFVLVEGLIPIW